MTQAMSYDQQLFNASVRAEGPFHAPGAQSFLRISRLPAAQSRNSPSPCAVQATWLRSGYIAVLGRLTFAGDVNAVSARVFCGIHGSVGIAEEFFSGAAVLGKDTDSDAKSQIDLPATDLNGLGGVTNNLLTAALDVSYGVEIGHDNDEFVSPHARHAVGFANGGEQALPHSREEAVADSVAKRVVDLFKEVDINEEHRDFLVMVLPSEDRLAETLLEQLAVGEAGQVIVMREVVDVIGATAVLGNVAAGNGDSSAEPDDLDIKPGAPDHLVVDEYFSGIGDPSPNNLAISMDQSGFDHEGSNLGEDLAIEGFARHAEPTLGIRVDVTESEVDDLTQGIVNAVKDVEVVQSAFSGRKEAREVRCGRSACLPMPWRSHCLQESEAPRPETSPEHVECSALLVLGR